MATVAPVADEPGRPGALQARPQTLVAMRPVPRGGGPPRPPGLRSPSPGRRRSRLALPPSRPAGTFTFSSTGVGAGGQSGQGGVDRLLIDHGHKLLVLQLATTLIEVTHLFVHGLQVSGRRAAGGVHPLLDAAAALVDRGDLCLQLLLRRRERALLPPTAPSRAASACNSASRAVRPKRSASTSRRCASWVINVSRSCTTSSRSNDSVTPPPLNLPCRWPPLSRPDSSASHSARATTKAGASASSAIAAASSQSNQRASGLSPGGG